MNHPDPHEAPDESETELYGALSESDADAGPSGPIGEDGTSNGGGDGDAAPPAPGGGPAPSFQSIIASAVVW